MRVAPAPPAPRSWQGATWPGCFAWRARRLPLLRFPARALPLRGTPAHRGPCPPGRMAANTNRLPRTAVAGFWATCTRMCGAFARTTGAIATRRFRFESASIVGLLYKPSEPPTCARTPRRRPSMAPASARRTVRSGCYPSVSRTDRCWYASLCCLHAQGRVATPLPLGPTTCSATATRFAPNSSMLADSRVWSQYGPETGPLGI